MYPDDRNFQDLIIKSVVSYGSGDGWSIDMGKFSFYVPQDSIVIPKEGMIARFYSEGHGSVRGLFLDGKQIYYYTKEQFKEKQAIDLYGLDASDWLNRWDRGDVVWSIELGGLGPSYEQVIQIMSAEFVRHMLSMKYNSENWKDCEKWAVDFNKIESDCVLKDYAAYFGISGAQWYSALSFATSLYSDGPRKVMAEVEKERHIQINRNFPQYWRIE
jgi:hypothetical protein